jgi:hypothetical protein
MLHPVIESVKQHFKKHMLKTYTKTEDYNKSEDNDYGLKGKN